MGEKVDSQILPTVSSLYAKLVNQTCNFCIFYLILLVLLFALFFCFVLVLSYHVYGRIKHPKQSHKANDTVEEKEQLNFRER